MGYETKDSGERAEYESGMRRDTQQGKPRFDLLLVDDMPYSEQFLTRWAELMDRGAEKYGERNWQLADSEEELARFKASALRHMMQWMNGERDEDHAAAVAFNLMAAEYVTWKLTKDVKSFQLVAALPNDIDSDIVNAAFDDAFDEKQQRMQNESVELTLTESVDDAWDAFRVKGMTYDGDA